MEMKHTPGPWHIAPKTATYRALPPDDIAEKMKIFGVPFQFDAVSVGTKHGTVALIPLDESNEANARLIASAPDLLDALRQIAAYPVHRAEEISIDGARAIARAAIAAAEAAQPTAVPDGWKLVPVEPTDEMLAAGSEQDQQFYDHARFVYRAMLAAAPKPEGGAR
jgi:hypothetical protein